MSQHLKYKYKDIGTYCVNCDDYFLFNHTHCPECNSAPEHHFTTNLNEVLRLADVYCRKCKAYVREWDPN